MAPKVSVIIPIYNAMPYLTQMMDSVCAQTLKDIEIICVDDGSTDNSCKVIDEYCAKDNRVRLIRQEHSNAGAARNNGLQFAAGEYLAFLDADDFFEPEMLEKAVNKAEEDKSAVVVFRSDQFTDVNGRYYPSTYTINRNLIPLTTPFSALDVEKDFFRVFVWWPWDKLFRTDLIRQNNLKFQEQRTTNDLFFVCSAVLKAPCISIIDHVLAHHRRLSAGSSLSVSRELSWDNCYYALIALRKKLREWDLYGRFEQDFINYCLNFLLWNLHSLKGTAYHLLYNKLREEWFNDLGIAGKDSDYFYYESEYNSYTKVISLESEDYLFYRIDSFINELNDNKRQLKETNQQLKNMQNAISSLENSVSFRIGRLITWPGRKLRDVIRS